MITYNPQEEESSEAAAKEPDPEAEGSSPESDGEAARQREARAAASIKEREKEVQRALANSLRDRDKEREYHKRDEAVQERKKEVKRAFATIMHVMHKERDYYKRNEAVQHFNALLADLVRNPELVWREAKKQLKKDHRYSLAELLTKDDKERLFSLHISNLASKRREKFRTLLAELGVSCTVPWRDVKSKLKNDPSTPAYISGTQMEREFREYQRDVQSAAKTSLRQLLLETRSVTHRTLALVKENPAALQAVRDSISQDGRYLALNHIPEEREQIIMTHIEELAKKGPPPPPTATEPTRRAKQ